MRVDLDQAADVEAFPADRAKMVYGPSRMRCGRRQVPGDAKLDLHGEAGEVAIAKLVITPQH
jgi:hypothetical protein